MKIKILAKKLSLSGIDKSLCSIVNMLSVNHEVTLVQTYKEENGTHKLNDNVKQVFLLSSEKEEKRSIVKKLLLKIKVGFLNKSVIKIMYVTCFLFEIKFFKLIIIGIKTIEL